MEIGRIIEKKLAHSLQIQFFLCSCTEGFVFLERQIDKIDGFSSMLFKLKKKPLGFSILKANQRFFACQNQL